LLEAKFGDHASAVAMAWLVARIRQRAGARKAGGDRLGYLTGSLGALAGAEANRLRQIGVDIRVSTRVQGIRRTADAWEVELDGPEGFSQLKASTVIACLSGPVLDKMVDLPAQYASAIRAIPYRGIVCVLLEMARSLSPYYWVNLTDRLGLDCVGIIEHTNFIPSDRYGGRTLVYLAHYVSQGSPAWKASPDELVDAVIPAMRSMNSDFSRDWILDIHVNRDPYAQPVPTIGGPMNRLTVETGLPGLFHASLAHVYPDDRGVSKALSLGAKVADAAKAFLGRI
jgi:protoporphyrinogen oxidase